MPRRRDEVEIRFRDLDEVAEDRGVADLQRLDARGLLLALLELRDPVLPLMRGGAQLVELREVAIAKHAAVARERGRLIDDGAGEQLMQMRQLVQLAQEARPHALAAPTERREVRLQRGDLLEARAQNEQVARVAAGLCEPADRALEI